MLEVIACSVQDARAAREGGADRIELLRATDGPEGVTATPETVAEVLAAVDIPVRVFLREDPDTFVASPAELDALCATAERLHAAGAREFVFGFLTPEAAIDRRALERLWHATGRSPWTLHRAFDAVADRQAAWAVATELEGCDTVLTAGSPLGVDRGWKALVQTASRQSPDAPVVTAGGGLRPEHLPALRAAGVRAFHFGTRARAVPGGPVDAARVRELATLAAGPS